MQVRNNQDHTHEVSHKSPFYYTKEMIKTIDLASFACTFIGATGFDDNMQMCKRVPLILLGLFGALLPVAMLPGSIITVPFDLAVNVKKYCNNYNKAVFFKTTKDEFKISQSSSLRRANKKEIDITYKKSK